MMIHGSALTSRNSTAQSSQPGLCDGRLYDGEKDHVEAEVDFFSDFAEEKRKKKVQECLNLLESDLGVNEGHPGASGCGGDGSERSEATQSTWTTGRMSRWRWRVWRRAGRGL